MKTDGKKQGRGETEVGKDGRKTGTETGGKTPDNRQETVQQRDKNGRFVKGVSGNPSGRPSMPTDVKQRLISLLPKAIDTIQSMIEDERVKPEVRIKAAEMIVERNLGKAVTPVLTETVGEGSTLTLSEMIACAKELLEQ